MRKPVDLPVERGRCVWASKPMARVWMNKDGAATFDYVVTRMSDPCACQFTLFCKVGEPYQHLFAPFFEKYEIVGTVDYGDRKPYIADKIQKKS